MFGCFAPPANHGSCRYDAVRQRELDIRLRPDWDLLPGLNEDTASRDVTGKPRVELRFTFERDLHLQEETLVRTLFEMSLRHKLSNIKVPYPRAQHRLLPRLPVECASA
jgi:hypothetical protein